MLKTAFSNSNEAKTEKLNEAFSLISQGLRWWNKTSNVGKAEDVGGTILLGWMTGEGMEMAWPEAPYSGVPASVKPYLSRVNNNYNFGNYGGEFLDDGFTFNQKGYTQTIAAPEDYFNFALKQQGFNSSDAAPASFKQSWTENGYEFEVRSHPAEAQYGKTGSIYRVARHLLGKKANGDGFGREYLDDKGVRHPMSTLKQKSPTFNNNAASDTHIQAPTKLK